MENNIIRKVKATQYEDFGTCESGPDVHAYIIGYFDSEEEAIAVYAGKNPSEVPFNETYGLSFEEVTFTPDEWIKELESLNEYEIALPFLADILAAQCGVYNGLKQEVKKVATPERWKGWQEDFVTTTTSFQTAKGLKVSVIEHLWGTPEAYAEVAFEDNVTRTVIDDARYSDDLRKLNDILSIYQA